MSQRVKFIGVALFTSALLLFNGVGALFGGYSLITDPTGGKIQLPFELIENTFFKDYFIPGIILFVCNGVLSIWALATVILNWRNAWFWVMLQGIILVTWIVVQMMVIQMTFYLQFIMGVTGVLLVFMGYVLRKQKA